VIEKGKLGKGCEKMAGSEGKRVQSLHFTHCKPLLTTEAGHVHWPCPLMLLSPTWITSSVQDSNLALQNADVFVARKYQIQFW